MKSNEMDSTCSTNDDTVTRNVDKK